MGSKNPSKKRSLIRTGIVCFLWYIALLALHGIMSFGEAFVEGINVYRLYTWGILTSVVTTIFVILNSRKSTIASHFSNNGAAE